MHRPVFDLGIGRLVGPTRAINSASASRLNRDRLYYEGPARPRGPKHPPLRSPSQRLRGHAALRRLPVVGRCKLNLGKRSLRTSPSRSIRRSAGCPTGARTPAVSCRTKQLTGELYVRWFPVSAPSARCFRSHGRTWKTALCPWQWKHRRARSGRSGVSRGADPDPGRIAQRGQSSLSAVSTWNCATA